MVWLIVVSQLRKALAFSGELKDTCIDLGGRRVGVLVESCWMRWTSVMDGYCDLRVDLKSLQASSKVLGNSVSQKRKRLSGRLSTNVMDSSASRGGGRILNWWWMVLSLNSVFWNRLSLSSRVLRWIMIMLGSCRGVWKLEQEIFR